MTLFGYKVHTAKYPRKEQEDTFVPIFGFSCWTFNDRKRKPWEPGVQRIILKRPIIAVEKNFYFHVWIFSTRFDLNLSKYIPIEGNNA